MCQNILTNKNTKYLLIGNNLDIFPNDPIHRYNIPIFNNMKKFFISSINDDLDFMLIEIYKLVFDLESNKSEIVELYKKFSINNKCC